MNVRAHAVLCLALLALWLGSPGCAGGRGSSGAGGDGGGSHGAAPAATNAASTLSPALRAAYVDAVQANAGDKYAPRSEGARVVADNPAQRLTAELSDGGLALHARDARFQTTLALSRMGCGGALVPVGAASPALRAQRMELGRPSVVEWYVNGPLGLEQGFSLPVRPCAGEGAMELEIAVDGDLSPRLPVGAAPTEWVELVDGRGSVQLAYSDLFVHDADGRAVTATLGVEGGRIRIRVEDQDARYPLVVDPLVWAQQAKLLASDGADSDSFANSVALSVDTAVIGAYQDDDKGTDSGSAYVFNRVGNLWGQQAKLTAADGAAGDNFGFSVAVDGDTAVIGAHRDDDKGTDSGSVYVFVRNGFVWTQQAKLTAADGTAQDNFGNSVSISGDTVVIGAWADSVTGTSSGSAYVFVRSGTVWTQQAKLTASDGATGDLFGNSVSVSGDTAVIGAYLDDDNGLNSGSAYVYVRSGTVWTQQQKIIPSDGVANDKFGASVSLSGETVVIGASDNALTNKGSAYVFVRVLGGLWIQQAKLLASDGVAGDNFGYSVSLSGDTAVIGAFGDDDKGTNSGSAYVFARNGTAWTQQVKLTASDGANDDHFGYSVSVLGDTALIGAKDKFGNGFYEGAAYAFALRKANGDPCSGDIECASNHCADGVCCNTACNGGVCDACSIAAGAPTNGTCALLTGTPCNDGNACTQTDTCQAGVCKGTNPVVCTAADQCHLVGTCDTTTGLCSNLQKPNGTGCNDGNACTQIDVCQSGVCTGLSPVACTTSDQCHDPGTCDPTTGACSNPPKPNGTACSDGNACTQADACQAGVCTGAPVVCTASDPCHSVGTCDPTTGMCSNPAKADGSGCDDGNGCTHTDTCQAGVCTGGNPKVCPPPDQCHGAGACDPANGVCSYPPKADGSACDDGNGCTQADTCQAGACVGSNPVTCTALDPCHGAGTCDPTTGICSNPQKLDGTSCGAGQVCSSGACQSGCFIGGTLYAAGTMNPQKPCLACTPSLSTTAWSNAADGTACNDGNACTKGDVCTAGTCGGTAYTCTPTACQQSSTCDGLGGCTIVNKPNGAACPDDGNPCSSDTCDGAGTCTHPSLADGTNCGAGQLCQSGSCGAKCQIGGQFYASGTINPANACEQCSPSSSTTAWTARPDGTACDDGNGCTKADHCTAGACGGTAYACAPTTCQQSSTCDGNGGCTIVNKGSGVACPDDGNPCTSDACDGAGACAHANLADGTSCGAGQVCENGSCGTCFIGGTTYVAGAPNPANACEACAPAVSPTAFSPKADGSACDDGNACTQSETCQAGTCTGSTPVVCTAQDECHEAGTCDSTSGQCSNPAKPDGTSCSMGTCTAGACSSSSSSSSSGSVSSSSSSSSSSGGAGGSGGSSSSASSSSSSGAAGGSGGGVAPSSSSSGGEPTEQTGCGCRTAGGDDTSAPLPLLPLAAWVLARRRRGAAGRRS